MWFGGVWLSAATAVVAFWLPWVSWGLRDPSQLGGRSLTDALERLERSVGRVTITVTEGGQTVSGEVADLSRLPTRLTGAHIPRLARGPEASAMVVLIELLTDARHLGAKSLLVYLVPGVALLGVVVVTWGRRRRIACLLVGLASLAIAGWGWWRLLTVPTNTASIRLVIEHGLWLSVWAYAGLGFASLMVALLNTKHACVRAEDTRAAPRLA